MSHCGLTLYTAEVRLVTSFSFTRTFLTTASNCFVQLLFNLRKQLKSGRPQQPSCSQDLIHVAEDLTAAPPQWRRCARRVTPQVKCSRHLCLILWDVQVGFELRCTVVLVTDTYCAVRVNKDRGVHWGCSGGAVGVQWPPSAATTSMSSHGDARQRQTPATIFKHVRRS